MKLRLFAALLLLAAGLALWVGLRPSAPGLSNAPAPRQLAAATSPAPVLAAPATPPAAAGAPSPVAAPVPDVPGEEYLAKLPPGPLRTFILALTPSARNAALARLSRLNPPKEDYPNLHVSPDGHVFIVCDFLPPAQPALKDVPARVPAKALAIAAGGAANGAIISAASVPIATPPVRHSRPGATNVLFLDFGGMTIANTEWNSSYSVTSWQANPYNLDGDPTTFSDTEQANIIDIWQRVSEHYAPFDVDVTTERPAVMTRTTGHALITSSLDHNSVPMPASGAGGVAFVGVFGDSDYTSYTSPAFIYFDNLASGTIPSYIAEAASHELGHNMGLSHQGTNGANANTQPSTGGTNSYYMGHGTGEISWAPIMGGSYGKNVTQWCKGDYYDANNSEDALSIISGRLSYRPAVAGASLTTTGVVGVSGTSLSASGVIRNSADLNVYAFTTGAGTVTVNANPFLDASGTRGGGTDLKIELLDSGGNVVATADPPSHTYSSVSYAATAGTYYVRMSPQGTGTPMSSTPTGYTNYGSAGQYTLSGTIVAAAPVIVGTLNPSTPAGQTYSYQIMATNSPSSYAASGLPSGLTLNTTTGLISGRPLVVGTFPISVSATNSQGPGNGTVTLLVTDAPPAIIAQSASRQTVSLAGPISLSVSAVSPSGTASYQWLHNGFVVNGANSANLSLPTTSFADAGWYQALVTNAIGTSTSGIIFLQVAPATSAVSGWGSNNSGQITIPGGLTNVVGIAAGNSFAVALLGDGTVTAWGSNASLQTTIPNGLSGVVAIAAGQNHALALKSDGTVVSWGDNSYGQATPPAGLANVVGIAGGQYHSLAVKADGTVVAWGDNSFGEGSVPVSLTNAVAVAAGSYESLALKSDGTVVAWGTDNNHVTEVPVTLASARSLAAGQYISLATTSGGTVATWGYTPYSNGLSSQSAVRQVAAGTDHALALKTDGTIYGGGQNGSGQITIPGGLTNCFGIAGGNLFSLVVRDSYAYVAPSISTQPTNQTATIGGAASFSVSATGNPSPFFQWRKAGVPILGATTSALSLSNVSIADAGTYDVVVSTGAGSVTSSAVTLRLYQSISFGALPDQYYGAGPLTLTATASSGLAVTFAKNSGPANLSGNSLALSGTGSVSVRASQVGDSTYAAAPNVDQAFNVLPSFATWQATNFTPAEILAGSVTGPAYVYGQDGLPNLVKYALGLPAKTNATTGLPVLSTDGSNWIYTITKPSAASDVTITAEFSADLVTWSTAGVTQQLPVTNAGTDTIVATHTVIGAPNGFFRLNVTH